MAVVLVSVSQRIEFVPYIARGCYANGELECQKLASDSVPTVLISKEETSN